MSEIVEHPRSLCALGAQQSVAAIERAIPILHAGQDVGISSILVLVISMDSREADIAAGSAIVCTNMGEKRLFLAVRTACALLLTGRLKSWTAIFSWSCRDAQRSLSAMISEVLSGVIAMTVFQSSSRRHRFKGSNLAGHELVVSAIIDQILEPAKQVVPGLVNVWSSVPYHDPFWAGNLLEIRRLLKGIGLEANVLFGRIRVGSMHGNGSLRRNSILFWLPGPGWGQPENWREVRRPVVPSRTLPIGSREQVSF